MAKKKQVAFTIADEANLPYAKMMANSLRKFHSEEELPLLIYQPDGSDPSIFYKATPHFGKDLITQYDLVLKLDADQIITGSLDHMLNDTSYDVGTVLNWNRVDPQLFGLVSTGPIDPGQYFNCGLVAMRSESFVKKWAELCESPFFDRLQYREQDILNYMSYFGGWKVKCLDYDDTWNGLVSKGEWPRVQLKGDDLVVIPEVLPDGKLFPEVNKKLCVLHWAGGKSPDKMNYRIGFNDDVIKRLDYLVSNEKSK